MKRMLHLKPERGWMNDPNGLCFFKGLFHVFYQCNPHGLDWARMHWGHAVSRNLIDWEYCPIALYPDRSYECDEDGGCFSGSAIVVGDRLFLIYTAVGGGKQRVCLAYSDDGVNFKKHDGNPIIENPLFRDFRDPKVFLHDGKYYLVIGAYDKTGKGQILLYSSSNLLEWNYIGPLFAAGKNIGTMLECPDLFFLDGKWVLTFSPVDEGYDGYPAMAVIGDVDFSKPGFLVENIIPLDYGKDFYATQTFMHEDRRIMFAWCGSWPWLPEFNGFDKHDAYTGHLSLPRECHIRDGRFYSKPVMEVEELFNGAGREIEISSERVRLEVVNRLRIEKMLEGKRSGKIEIGISGSHRLIIDFRGSNAVFLSMEEGGIKSLSNIPFCKSDKFILEVFYDCDTLEVFINEGEATYTENIGLGESFSPWIRSLEGINLLKIF